MSNSPSSSQVLQIYNSVTGRNLSRACIFNNKGKNNRTFKLWLEKVSSTEIEDLTKVYKKSFPETFIQIRNMTSRPSNLWRGEWTENKVVVTFSI